LPGKRGLLTADQVAASIHGGRDHVSPTVMVAVENTHNRGSGTCYDPAELERIAAVAHARKCVVHMDGARLWNAAAALGRPEIDFAKHADTVSVCFSKGLGAPVGSIVAGSAAFIVRAHRYRKLFGGGMRQMGILAAAALYAVEHHRARLSEDHAKAQELTTLLMESGRVEIERPVQTNILIVEITRSKLGAPELVRRCAADGVLFFPEGATKFRLVTHLDVAAKAIKPAAEIILKHLEA
jgi:threonine aldolase